MKLNISVGVFFYAKETKRFLYLLRNDSKFPNTWGIPGGKLEEEESITDAIKRECWEELKYISSDDKFIPIQKFINHNFVYHTFFCEIEQEFLPTLNNEHKGYSWVEFMSYPKPLHPGLFNTINLDIVMDKLTKLIK